MNPPAETRKLKVLLIDDEPFIRTTIRQILVQIGLAPTNIYEVGTARAAMSETLRVRPDIVLCDIHMPGEDGFVFLSFLRAAPLADVAAIPVVMLTSDARQEAVVTAKDLHVNGYLVKPVSINAVKQAMERALKVSFG